MSGGIVAGRNSRSIRNHKLSPAKLVMLEQQGAEQLFVEFDIVAREGQFSDTTIAQYSAKGGNSVLNKYISNQAAKLSPTFMKGELTTSYEGVVPKYINFDIIYRADGDLAPSEIRERVIVLQSLCYPKLAIGYNPPLCILHILNLYSLEVYVSQVLVNWHNTWTIGPSFRDEDSGLPMGCDISMTCMMHQYPTRDEILAGAGFDSTRFMGRGFSGDLSKTQTTLSRVNRMADLEQRNRAAVDALGGASGVVNKNVRAAQREVYQRTMPDSV